MMNLRLWWEKHIYRAVSWSWAHPLLVQLLSFGFFAGAAIVGWIFPKHAVRPVVLSPHYLIAQIDPKYSIATGIAALVYLTLFLSPASALDPIGVTKRIGLAFFCIMLVMLSTSASIGILVACDAIIHEVTLYDYLLVAHLLLAYGLDGFIYITRALSSSTVPTSSNHFATTESGAYRPFAGPAAKIAATGPELLAIGFANTSCAIYGVILEEITNRNRIWLLTTVALLILLVNQWTTYVGRLSLVSTAANDSRGGQRISRSGCLGFLQRGLAKASYGLASSALTRVSVLLFFLGWTTFGLIQISEHVKNTDFGSSSLARMLVLTGITSVPGLVFSGIAASLLSALSTISASASFVGLQSILRLAHGIEFLALEGEKWTYLIFGAASSTSVVLPAYFVYQKTPGATMLRIKATAQKALPNIFAATIGPKLFVFPVLLALAHQRRAAFAGISVFLWAEVYTFLIPSLIYWFALLARDRSDNSASNNIRERAAGEGSTLLDPLIDYPSSSEDEEKED